MSNYTQANEKKYVSSPFERNPPCYKEVEKVLKEVKACKGNLKTVLYSSRYRGAFFKKVYSLAENVLKHRLMLEKIIEDIKLSEKEPFLRKEYAGILIYELILGKGLPGNSKPVVTIKKYESEIREAYHIAKKDGNLCPTGLYSLPKYVRINTLVTSVSKVLEHLRNGGFQQMQYDRSTSFDGYLNLVKSLQIGYFLIDFHFKDLLVFASKENLPSLQLYQEGHIFIQDKSSYIPVHVLDPKPGCTVIDSCAAPGMKTKHIASAMKNQGQIYAYERDEGRFKILQQMLEAANINICEAACEDFYLVNTNDPKFHSLEYILVDPSCSGSGMVNRMDSVTDTEDSKNKHRLEKLAGFQILLLKHALSFPFVKRVVYSTCSITEEENEFVVHEVLNKFRNVFKLVSVMPDWPFRGSENFEFGHLCLRAYPDKSLTNGFFVAMFERLEGDEYFSGDLNSNCGSSKRTTTKNKFKNGHFEDFTVKQEVPGSIFKEENFVNMNEDKVDYEGNRSKRRKHKEKLSYENEEMIPNDSSDKITEPSFATSELEDNARKKKHKKKRRHSEAQETILEEECDVTKNDSDKVGLPFDLKAADELEKGPKKKKHKKKRRHSEGEEALLEDKCDNVTENCIEVNYSDNIVKKKHKTKKRHLEYQETPAEGVLNSVTEISTDFKTVNDFDDKLKKQHKKKKFIQKTRKNLAENSMENKTTNDLEDNLTNKKHRKKKCRKTQQDVALESVS